MTSHPWSNPDTGSSQPLLRGDNMQRPMGSFREHFDCKRSPSEVESSEQNPNYYSEQRESVSPLASPFQEQDCKELPYEVDSPEQIVNYHPQHGESISPLTNRHSSSGLEFVKRVIVTDNGAETATADSPEKETYTPNYPPQGPSGNTSQKRGKKMWLWAFLISVVCIAIALGVGLGVGLTHKAGLVFLFFGSN